MRCVLIAVLCLVMMTLPVAAESSDFNFGIHISRLADGSTCGEVVLDNKVIWKLQILADGAWPVSGSTASGTVISPDIINGMFMIKVHHEPI